jgi:hypothetical protein
MRRASLVLFSLSVCVFKVFGLSDRAVAQGQPVPNNMPYHVGSDGVVYLHSPTEVTAGTSSTQWIQPCPEQGAWITPQANCAPVMQPMVTVPVAQQASPLRWRVFGDFLYLRPSDGANISYALPVNGVVLPPDPPVPVGPVAVVDPSHEPGFRVGLGHAMEYCSEWAVMYTHFESDASSSVAVDPADVIVLSPLVLHPGTIAADAVYTQASASGNIKMNLGDVEYRRMIPDPAYQIGYVAGARYAQLEQDFSARFENVTTIETVDSEIRFHGGGIRVGLEADWRSKQTGFLVYSNGYGSIVAGEFKSSFTQQDNFLGTVVSTSREDGRIVPILDLEVGLGWQSAAGHIRFTAGYLVSAWLNVVSSSEWIEAVQTSQYDNLSDSLFFDGLVARAEFRF